MVVTNIVTGDTICVISALCKKPANVRWWAFCVFGYVAYDVHIYVVYLQKGGVICVDKGENQKYITWEEIVMAGLLLGASAIMFKVSMREREGAEKEPVTLFDKLFDVIEGKK